MENKVEEGLISKLKYLGLDTDNIPEYLKDFKPISFNISRLNSDRDHRVFKFIPIDKIQILLTPSHRNDDINEKYKKAVPLGRFFNSTGNEEDIERYSTLLKLLSKLSIPEVENISVLQKEFQTCEPFKVKYKKDHMWQMYYSEPTDSYFMLVCTKEDTFSEFFYLLKEKIKFEKSKGSKKVPQIFVPINYTNYSGDFLTNDEIVDLENYLWLLTKNWALVFEVYGQNEEPSLQVIGDTFVFEKIKSTYKMKLKTPDEAIKFYKLLKALFIMQTDIKDHFKFETKVNTKNELEFYFGQIRVTYDSLESFIKNEYLIATEEMKNQSNEYHELEKKLKSLQKKSKQKENEYLEKQREISTYLEYKKTFLGKVRFFFKGTKSSKNKAATEKQSSNSDESKKSKSNILNDEIYFKEKEYYTLEDLVTVYHVKEKNDKLLKNVNQDIKALNLKIENLTSKVKNAKLYIEEIDKHRKSIFDFWRYASKDEKLSLEVGSEETKENEKSQIKKSFDFETDFEKLGQEIDRLQRIRLSKDELDSLFIAGSNLLYILNMIRCNDMDKNALEQALDLLREEYNSNRLYINSENYDIFGSVENDSRKVRYIGSRSHRENEKSKFKILNINRKIDVFDFTERLHSIVNYLQESTSKITSKYDFPIYKVVPITEKIKEKCFDIYNINVENELESYNDLGESVLNLVKLNFKEGMPILYYSNSVLFDNTSQTLPEGMDLSTRVLIDCDKFDFKLVKKDKFRTNNYFNEKNNLINPKTKDILVFEYDLSLKNDLKEESNEEN